MRFLAASGHSIDRKKRPAMQIAPPFNRVFKKGKSGGNGPAAGPGRDESGLCVTGLKHFAWPADANLYTGCRALAAGAIRENPEKFF
ncbi:hypothetical protein [Burkholderia ubonensis]|uniref:hypothetical protein n=1 Tax=Burkholderia ubonensis TaxID=101571 RepID=UPI000AEF80FF|nr:hypothetical protein [Burkholderia ubonensis]